MFSNEFVSFILFFKILKMIKKYKKKKKERKEKLFYGIRYQIFDICNTSHFLLFFLIFNYYYS